MKRLDWIDALKGFAILSVVIGHCIDGVRKGDTYSEYAYALQAAFDFIYAFHMPLFFAISGYVFWSSKSYRKYRPKILDFGLVYLFWSILMWASKFMLAKDVNSPLSAADIFRIFYHPIPPYWYLYVLICLYILTSWMKPLVNTKLLFAAAICAVDVKLLSPPPPSSIKSFTICPSFSWAASLRNPLYLKT